MARRKAPSPEATEAAQVAAEAARRVREAEAARQAEEDARLAAEAARRVEEVAAQYRAAETERLAAEQAALDALALRAEADADIARCKLQIDVLKTRAGEFTEAYVEHSKRERENDPAIPKEAPQGLRA